MVAGSQVVMDCGPESSDTIPEATNDPPSACGVLARKNRDFKSSVVGLQQFPLVLSLKKFSLLFRDKSKFWRVFSSIYRDWNWTVVSRPLLPGDVPFCLKPHRNAIWGLVSRMA